MGREARVLGKEWQTLDEAVEYLGKSPKTIERLVSAEILRSRLEPREGRKAQRLYHAGDLERVKTEAISAPQPEPKEKKTTQEVATLTPALADVAARWLDRAEKPEPKPWLTLLEASERSGLTTAYLRRVIREGKIVAVPGGPFGQLRVSRASLGAFAG